MTAWAKDLKGARDAAYAAVDTLRFDGARCGASSNGTVFAINTDGSGYTNLYNFSATPQFTNSDGSQPGCRLVLFSNTLFGTASSGGTFGSGAVFAVGTNGMGFRNLYNFTAPARPQLTNSDGAHPFAGLILWSNTLYGATENGGTNGNGTVYSIFVPDLTGQDFNTALNTTGLVWTTSGDTSWFVETTNTYDGVSAAQSGSVTNSQTSTLSVTVTGSGSLSFYWSSIGVDDGMFYYGFGIDGNEYYRNPAGVPWSQVGPMTISDGQHTLSWTTYANGSTDPTHAGVLDQVSHVSILPIILLDPQIVGTNFQAQFSSQAGIYYTVYYSTDLASGNWIFYVGIFGDGTLQVISIPVDVFSPAQKAFVRLVVN